ncbi:MAG: hypothetical protein Q7J27_09000, partial [Syntrophales bacterium]|nr:hypothetical protein [Syntrophales bacterium]
MGEGWGEGESDDISSGDIPLPFVPSHRGRGNSTFYKCIILDTRKFFMDLFLPLWVIFHT